MLLLNWLFCRHEFRFDYSTKGRWRLRCAKCSAQTEGVEVGTC